MVVTMNIANYDVHHVFIDNESSVDVLFYEALFKMHIFLERFEGTYVLLIGLFREPVLIGAIVLLVIVGQGPRHS